MDEEAHAVRSRGVNLADPRLGAAAIFGGTLMVQQDTPDDYVVATGETHAVRERCRLAFEAGLCDRRVLEHLNGLGHGADFFRPPQP